MNDHADQRGFVGTWLMMSAAAAVVAGFVVVMAVQSHRWPAQAGESVPAKALWVYGAGFTATWTMLTVLAWRLHRARHVGNFARLAWAIIAVALLARVAVALTTQPLLSDDIWRYIHDGGMLAQGRNPYASAPAELEAHQAPVPKAWARVNHPALVTIYQPVSQYVFALLHETHAWLTQMWGEFDASRTLTYRLGFIAFDGMIVVLLLWQLRQWGRSPWWAALYAWHPLAISEVAGSGHQDVIGVACLVGTLVAAHGLERRDDAHGGPAGFAALTPRLGEVWRLSLLAGALFALAVAVKPIVLPLALPLAWRVRRSGYAAPMIAVAVAGVVGVLCYVPFLAMDGGLVRMLDTARTFVDQWAFNGSLHAMAAWALESKLAADRLMTLGLMGTLLAVTFWRVDVWRAAGVYLLGSVLLSSTVHPWYVLWALAMVAMRFDPVVWVLSLTVVLGYEAHLHPETFKPTSWVAWAVYGPVYGAIAGMGVWAVRERMHTKSRRFVL